MTAFHSRHRSAATLPVPHDDIWAVLSDPSMLASLTPLVDRIEAAGDRWTWTLNGISGLGVEVAPTFTERMTFIPISRIDYVHEAPPGRTERAGANGTYQLTKVDESTTKLKIDITLCVELPLPSFSRGPVESIMARSMRRTGDAFARNLYAYFDIDPDSVDVRVLEGA